MSRPDVLEMVNQLVDRHTTREAYTTLENQGGTVVTATGHHTTTNESLLTQLAEAVEPSSAAGASGLGFASKPAARLDAIDTLAQIDLAAARWVRDLGEDDPGDTAACIRKLAGLRASADAVTVKAVDRDVCRWWTWARITTGWDRPAFKLDNTCPLCSERGTLRVKIVDVIGMCADCNATWSGDDEIKMLARHIKWENNDEDQEPAA